MQKCPRLFLRVVHCEGRPDASPQPLLVDVPWRCTSRYLLGMSCHTEMPQVDPLVVHCEGRPHSSPQPLLVGMSWRCTSRLPPSHVMSCRKAHSWCIVKAGLTPALLVVCHGMLWRSTSGLFLGPCHGDTSFSMYTLLKSNICGRKTPIYLLT